MSEPSDNSNLVRRLRTDAAMNAEIPVKTHLQDTAKIEAEAADAIERLQAEIARRTNVAAEDLSRLQARVAELESALDEELH